MKIVIYLGTSGSGKTTHILKTYIKEKTITEEKINSIPVSIVDETILFGRYISENRCKGCDTLSMSIIDTLLITLKEIVDSNKYENIILDGDRINNSKITNFLKDYKDIVEIVWIKTDLDIIFKRLPDCNKQFVKTTQTKTVKSVAKYSSLGFNIKKIETKSKGGLFGY